MNPMVKKIRARLSAIRHTFSTLRGAGLLVGMRPDRYWRMAQAVRREGTTNTVGIAMSAQRCPDRLALIDEQGSLTYRELDARAAALAAALQDKPFDAPEKVAIMCRNHRGFVEALAATDRIGADALLVNTSFAGPALVEVLERERPGLFICDEEFASGLQLPLSGVPDMETLPARESEGKAQPSVSTLIASNLGRRPKRRNRKGQLILLTSGTTGSPKGARRSSGGGAAELSAVLSRVPWRAEETTVVAAPMFHAWGYGQLVLNTLMSCTLVVKSKFDAEATLEMVDRQRATGLSVVPVMIERIMDLPSDIREKYSGRSLRFVTASGSRMRPDSVISFMDQFGDVVYNNYNATEVGMIATASPEDLRAAPDTAGRPLDGVRIRILGDDKNDVPRGQVGQIFAATPSQFDEYTSGETKAFEQGYMASGDLGYLDENGRLFVVGRDDEMIVSGGENVYPIEVENALLTHDAINEVSVVGVDDDKFGQRLAAFVALKPGFEADGDSLREHVRTRLANFKVPREVVILDELPRTNTGKILRRDLLSQIEQSHTAE